MKVSWGFEKFRLGRLQWFIVFDYVKTSKIDEEKNDENIFGAPGSLETD